MFARRASDSVYSILIIFIQLNKYNEMQQEQW